MKELKKEEELYAKVSSAEHRLTRDTVTEDDIASVVSRWTGMIKFCECILIICLLFYHN